MALFNNQLGRTPTTFMAVTVLSSTDVKTRVAPLLRSCRDSTTCYVVLRDSWVTIPSDADIYVIDVDYSSREVLLSAVMAIPARAGMVIFAGEHNPAEHLGYAERLWRAQHTETKPVEFVLDLGEEA